VYLALPVASLSISFVALLHDSHSLAVADDKTRIDYNEYVSQQAAPLPRCNALSPITLAEASPGFR
jgi:hypothetical protein